jgi:hypothetical protein
VTARLDGAIPLAEKLAEFRHSAGLNELERLHIISYRQINSGLPKITE